MQVFERLDVHAVVAATTMRLLERNSSPAARPMSVVCSGWTPHRATRNSEPSPRAFNTFNNKYCLGSRVDKTCRLLDPKSFVRQGQHQS